MTVGQRGRLVGTMKGLILLLLGCALARPLAATVTVGAWKPLFQGVELAAGEADAAEVRLQKVWAVRVDLRAPGIEFFTTPSNGDRPLDTTSETTSEFVMHYGVQVAINANFFGPCCSPGEKDLTGLAVSRGVVVSAPVLDGPGSAQMVITRDNQARIVVNTSKRPVPMADVWTAVAGSHIVLANGVKTDAAATATAKAVHPRTAVGVSKDGRYLFMLVIDGRQSGYSAGATFGELADWFLRFGASDGLNLDGGGSTAMVQNVDGLAVVLNRPSGVGLGSIGFMTKEGEPRPQRSNGNNFGVFARPLAKTGASGAGR